ncbi:hypothetical protein HMPREF0653_01961 [Prevotella disiens JCM 6334 = ATCC 29426]|uniref:Uncharacterized protein n=1 Tax=Prevotella disiens JCM 6334 = ATCC 29426 TaxID=1235811 RepID=A0ABN0NQI7_9BACT|nr:hypothetical protein HMPREF0653_01961 [Prevotella disiens JCM 6334 = ATCC 29426]
MIKSLEKKVNDYYFIKHCFRGSKKKEFKFIEIFKKILSLFV